MTPDTLPRIDPALRRVITFLEAERDNRSVVRPYAEDFQLAICALKFAAKQMPKVKYEREI